MGNIKDYSSKGGKASGEARRNKRTLKEALVLAMSLGVTEEETEKLNGLGAEPEDMTQITLIALGIIERAKRGDLNAVNYLNSQLRDSNMTELQLHEYYKL